MTTRVTLIGDGAVNSNTILNTTIKTEDLENNAVTSDKLQSGGNDNVRAVGTNHIQDKAVTAAKIADGNVTTAKIADSSVTADKLASGAAVPVGAVFHFAAATPPTGYLKANGDTVPNGVGTVQGVTANFAPLYEVLGSTYGAAGKLPDLRGEFIRGWDNGRGVDTDRTFGTFQADVLKSHTHTFTFYQGGWNSGGSYNTCLAYNQGNTNYNINANADGGTETRPRNVALLACIKF